MQKLIGFFPASTSIAPTETLQNLPKLIGFFPASAPIQPIEDLSFPKLIGFFNSSTVMDWGNATGSLIFEFQAPPPPPSSGGGGQRWLIGIGRIITIP